MQSAFGRYAQVSMTFWESRIVLRRSTSHHDPAHVAVFTTTSDRHVFVIDRTAMACRRHDEDIDRNLEVSAAESVHRWQKNDPDVNIFYEMLQSIAVAC